MGAEPGALLKGLGITERGLQDPRGRTRWSAYATMLGRAMRALDGPAAMSDLGARWVEGSRALGLAAGLAGGVRATYLVVCERVLRIAYPTIGVRAHAIDPSAIFVEIAIPRPSEGGVAFLHTVHGVLRAVPRLVGAPAADVRAEIAPREGRFAVSHSAAAPCRAPPAASIEEIEQMLALAFDDACLAAQARGLGEPLASETRFESLVHRLRAVLRERFACTSFVLHARLDGGQSLDFSPGPAFAKGSRRPLTVSGRDVGFVQTPALGLAQDGATPLFDFLLPWIALGVDRCLGSRPQAAKLPSVYRLTPRETSVVALLAQGRTNKEIALALGLTERTIETHLFNVYRKAGVPNRASLVSAYWTSAVGARPRRTAPGES
jgi:DNA-binding CsgD family transcriptional regulator